MKKQKLMRAFVILCMLVTTSAWLQAQQLFTEATDLQYGALKKLTTGQSVVAPGDYDNDGDLDLLVIGEESTGPVAYILQNYLNTGAGGFVNSTSSLVPDGLPGLLLGSANWLDYDNDGYLDFIITGYSGSTGTPANTNLAYLYHQVNGKFVKVDYPVYNKILKKQTNFVGVSSTSIAVGDFDKDGYVDIAYAGIPLSNYKAIGSSVARTVKLYKGQASATMPFLLDSVTYNLGTETSNSTYFPQTGGFTKLSGSATASISAYVGGMWFVDFDNNGTYDFIGSGYPNMAFKATTLANGSMSNKLYSTSGINGFPASRSFAGEWGDIDGDGDADLVTAYVASETSCKVSVLVNAGDGTFSEKSSLFGVVLNKVVAKGSERKFKEQSLSLGDYDNDGDLDILMQGVNSSSVPVAYLFKNTSSISSNGTYTLSFTDATTEAFGAAGVLAGHVTGSAKFIDADLDGDLDILVSGWTATDASISSANTNVGNFKLYINSLSSTAKPSSPAKITGFEVNNGVLPTLNWNKSTDNNSKGITETGKKSLTYIVRAGTSSKAFDLSNGMQSKLGVAGDIRPKATDSMAYYTIGHALTEGQMVYWSVKAVDNTYNQGEWSEEQSFKIEVADPVAISANASNLVVSAYTQNTASFNFVNGGSSSAGDGGSCLIFAKKGNDATDLPVLEKNKMYYANNKFGYGDQIGASGWFCVGKIVSALPNTSASSIIENLEPNTSYQIMVVTYAAKNSEAWVEYAIDGSGIAMRNTNNPITMSTSDFTQPAEAAYKISTTISSTDGVSGTFGFVRPAKYGTGHSMFWREYKQDGVVPKPLNNHSYKGNKVFGKGEELVDSTTKVGTGWYTLISDADTVVGSKSQGYYDASSVYKSIPFSGLTMGKIYEVVVYGFNGYGAWRKYNRAIVVSGSGKGTNDTSFTVPYIKPTTQSKNIIATITSTTSASITWTNGSGTTRCVFMADQALTSMPTLTAKTTYAGTTGSSADGVLTLDWANAQTSDNSGKYKCIYNGSDFNKITINSLTPNVTYTVAVVEYNGIANSENYMTTTATGNPAQFYPFAAPTSQVAKVSVTKTYDISAILTVVKDENGGGNSRLALVNTNTSVDVQPTLVENKTYKVGDVLNDGWVVAYNGTSTTLTLTGLTAETQYKTIVIDYSGLAGTEKYCSAIASSNVALFTTIKSQGIPSSIADVTAYWDAASQALPTNATISSYPLTYSSSDVSVAEVVDYSLQFHKGGTAVITVYQAGDGTYAPVTKTFKVTVQKYAQEITGLNSVEYLLYSGSGSFINFFPVASSGLAVVPTVTSSNSSEVTFYTTSDYIKAKIDGKGVYSIRFDQSGNDYYLAAASKTVSLNVVDKYPQTITGVPSSIVTEFGSSSLDLLPVSSTSGVKVFTFVSSSPTVASVSASGTVSFNAVGTTNIVVSEAGDNENMPASFTIIVSVTKKYQKITVDPTAITVKYGAPSVTVSVSSTVVGATITYSSSSSTIVSVTSSGTLTFNKPGSATITVASSATSDYFAGSATIAINLQKADQVITGFSNMDKWLETPVIIPSAVSSASLTITYTSSTNTVAEISSSGTIVMVGVGETSITATQSGNDYYSAASPVTVLLRVSSTRLAQTIPAIANYEVFADDANIVLPQLTSADLKISYVTADTSVVKPVSNTLKIKAAGTVTVTATQAGDGTYRPALKVQFTVTVKKHTQVLSTLSDITVKFSNPDITVGVTATSGLPVTYSIDDESVAVNKSQGVLRAINIGKTVVTAIQSGNDVWESTTSGSFNLTIEKGDQIFSNLSDLLAVLGEPDKLLKGQAVSGGTVTYSSDKPEIVSVISEFGYNKLSFNALGSASITAYQAGNSKYNAASITFTVTVISGKKPQSVGTYRDTTGVYGNKLTFREKSSAGLFIAYESSDPSIASVSNNTVLINKVGSVTITASQLGDEYFDIASSETFVLTSSKKSQSITNVSSAVAKVFGDNDFNLADIVAESGLPLTFTSSNESVIKVSGSIVSITGVGAATILVSQVGNENYLPTSATFIINVSAKSQSIKGLSDVSIKWPASTVTLPATSDASLPLSYSSSNTSVATVSSNVVTFYQAGSVTITATQTGNANYSTATAVSITVNVLAGSHNALFAVDGTLKIGGADVTPLVSSVSGATATYTSSSSSIISVVSGALRAVAEGSTTVSATFSKANYNDTIITRTVSVTNKLVQPIAFKIGNYKYTDGSFAISPFNTGAASTNTIVVSVVDGTACVVNASTISIVKAGKVTLRATQAGDDTYAASTQDTIIVIAKAPASVTATGGTYTYNGSAKAVSIVTVPSTGVSTTVTYNGLSTVPVTPGVYNVEVNIASENYTGVAATASIEIQKIVPTVTWTGGTAVYGASLTYVLKATSTSTASAVYSVATSTVLNVGSNNVSVWYPENSYYTAASATAAVVITPKPVTIVFSDLALNYIVGTKQKPTITLSDNIAYSVTYNGDINQPVNAASYTVNVTLNNSNYAISGASTATFIINPKAITFTISDPKYLYDGLSKRANLSISDAAALFTLKYNGSTQDPINAGSYKVEVATTEANYSGYAAGTLTITKIDVSKYISFSTGTSFLYDGTAKPASATISPSYALVMTYTSGTSTTEYTDAPINANNSSVSYYTAIATVNETNYQGSAKQQFKITPIPVTISITGGGSYTYTGIAKEISSTVSTPVSTTVSYSPSTPVNAGTYVATVEVTTPNYGGTASATIVILPKPVEVSITGGGTLTYDGTAKTVSYTLSETVSSTLTYSSTTAPINAGSYTATARVTNSNYSGAASVTIVIVPASVAVTVTGGGTYTYDGTLRAASYTLSLPVSATLTYSSASNTIPVNAGSYTATATVTDPNYTGTGSAIITIDPKLVSYEFSGLTTTYDGMSKTVVVTPSDASATFKVTNVSSYVNAGTYDVTATAEGNYTGTDTRQLVINQVSVAVNITGGGTYTYDGTERAVSYTISPNVSHELIYSSGSAPKSAGSYTAKVIISDANYYTPANDVAIVINRKPVTFTITGVNNIYDGASKTAIITSSDSKATTTIVNPTVVNAGSYPVSVTATGNYIGSASSTLVITPAPVTVTFSGGTYTYDGKSKAASFTLSPNVAYKLTYSSTTAPILAGTYSAYVVVNNSNYTGSGAASITINKAIRTISWPISDSIEYGTIIPLTATVSTSLTGESAVYSHTGLLAANDYVLSVSFAGDNNYSAVSKTGIKLKVYKAKLTVTVISDSVMKDKALPTFRYSITGYKNNEDSTVLTGAPALTANVDGAKVGDEVEIVAEQNTLSAANYRFSFVNGKLKIILNTATSFVVGGVDIKVYPNPVSEGMIKVVVPSFKGGSISVTSSTGSVILSKELVDETTEFDASALKSGSYIIRVVTSTGVATQQIIKL